MKARCVILCLFISVFLTGAYASPLTLQSLKPRIPEEICAEDEDYRPCEHCNRTCEDPYPVCSSECSKGCFCKEDLLRDKDGSCVKFEMCSNFDDYIKARDRPFGEPLSRFSCGPNKKYKECQKCTQSCDDPEPVCGKCIGGCVCDDGLVEGPYGKCIEKNQCPKGL